MQASAYVHLVRVWVRACVSDPLPVQLMGFPALPELGHTRNALLSFPLSQRLPDARRRGPSPHRLWSM